MALAAKKHLQEIFAQSQYSATSHERLFKQLKKLYDKMDADEFVTEFKHCLQVPLIHGDKHRCVENTLNFASKFIASLLQIKPANESNAEDEDEPICPFVLDVMKFLFENHNTEYQAIRFRVCQFINKILNSLGNEASMDDYLCDQISECMMERLQDKAPGVRMQAVLALHRLQDPYDVNCPVMKAFMFHMSSDPSADVRRAVITNIAVTTQSVRCMVERTHDMKESVRKTAYTSLAKFGVQRFTIIQRVRLLTDGLKDHSVIVRDCVAKVLLPAWLIHYKESFLSLLHALDCENSTEVSTLALQSLFKSEPIRVVLEELKKLLNEDKVIPVEKLNPESVLFWRVLTEYIENHPEIADNCPIDEPLPELVPELSTFCNYIKEYYEVKLAEECEHWVKLQHQYVLIQLLELCKNFDLADEMGRTNLQNLCLHFLTNNSVSEDVVPTVVQLMVKVIPDVEERLQVLAEAISEVREPMTEQEAEPATAAALPTLSTEEFRQRELKQAAIRVKINELKEEQDDAVRDRDFKRAQELKEEYEILQAKLKAISETPALPAPPPRTTEIRDAVKDETALRKCLRIVREMVQSDTVKNLSATLRSLMQNFVVPCLQEDNSAVIRNKALEALGLFSLLDKALAQDNFVMFCFQIAVDEVCEVALKVTFDLLLLYGLETFQIREDNGEASTKKKSKKKKNLFVTDMYDDEFDTEEEESQETLNSTNSGSSGNTSNLISMLTSLLDSASTAMRNLAMEGLYKLLMACRITSSALLSRLILMWYSPVTDGDETLRQPLGVFLTMYASHCPRSQETLEQAFLPTLRTLMQAPVTSPLTQVDQDSVTRLFINLTRPGINKFHSKVCHIHNNLAISICNEVMDCDDSTNISVLLRGLSSLELSLEDPVYRQELETLIKRTKEVFRTSKEKLFFRYLDKISVQIACAAESVSMRTTEVDNTAATSQLDATQTSNDITTNSEAQATSRRNKNAKLLHPHMHSILSGREDNEDDDEEEENSQKTLSASSDVVIPPSPPRSQSSDDESPAEVEVPERSRKVQKPTKDISNDGVFKRPMSRAKPTKPKSQEIERSTPESSDADVSPVPKRRRASKAEKDKQISGADQVTAGRSRSTKNQKGTPKVNARDVTTTDGDAVRQSSRKKGMDNVEEVVKERSPRRVINPTEKGATLKTFQNLSPLNRQSPERRSTESHHVTPPAKVTRKSPQKKPSGERSVATRAVSTPPANARRVSFQLDRDSIESPTSAAELQQKMMRKKAKTVVPEDSSSESALDSDVFITPPSQLSPSISDKTPETAKNGSKQKLDAAKSQPQGAGKRGRQPTEPSKSAQKRTGTPSYETDSESATRASRLRRRESSPSQPSSSPRTSASRTSPSRTSTSRTSASRTPVTTDSDSSPASSGRLRRARGKDGISLESKSSKSSSTKSSATASSDVDSDASPAPASGNRRKPVLKGITKLPEKALAARASRRNVLVSDSDGTNGTPPSSQSDSQSQSLDSPASAADQAQKLKKMAAKKAPEGSGNNASPPIARRSARGSGSQLPEVISLPSKKRSAQALKSASSDGCDSDSAQLSSRGAPNQSKTRNQSKHSTPTQPSKKPKTGTKAADEDTPPVRPQRRSLSTPSVDASDADLAQLAKRAHNEAKTRNQSKESTPTQPSKKPKTGTKTPGKETPPVRPQRRSQSAPSLDDSDSDFAQLAKGAHSEVKTRNQSKDSTPTQPSKKPKVGSKTTSKDTPPAKAPRRSMRSLDTPSPRTRSGKV